MACSLPEAQSETTMGMPTDPPRRRWFSYSLRTLLLAVTAVALLGSGCWCADTALRYASDRQYGPPDDGRLRLSWEAIGALQDRAEILLLVGAAMFLLAVASFVRDRWASRPATQL